MKRLTRMSIAAMAAVIVLNLSRPSPAAAPEWPVLAPRPDDGTLSVMTYNVKGLPFPLAQGRPEALARIAEGLRRLRREGRQPDVILLQEAFIPEAKAIARRAGYAHVSIGPGTDHAVAAPDERDTFLQQAAWMHGEALGRWLDSGLVILSDHPIVRTRRMAFSDAMCAGFDCLAAKGVVIAWVAVPGRSRPVAIADTHLNARKAAGVDIARANAAFARQARAARDFIAANVDADDDLIFGGDFNIGSDKARIAATRDLVSGGAEASAEADCSACAADLRADVAAIRKRGKDKQFYRGAMRLSRLDVPFGAAKGGEALSDHLGYVAHYALQ
ncbi:MAG TPA: endonuclease/exonuclease/phosphatase family protein [Novosphingobium sp.]|nr:endonuclease/exonuclease/phosphatase family protein [Novosphingobium sp.]